jgi:hypothetical protein
MEDVGKITGLVKRGNVYYYRVRIPKDLVDTVIQATDFVGCRQ